jgi:hypothetical protein
MSGCAKTMRPLEPYARLEGHRPEAFGELRLQAVEDEDLPWDMGACHYWPI